MKLGKCEISGKAINSKRLCFAGETQKHYRYFRTLKTNSKFLRRKWEKKERGCTFFTVQRLWSVLSFFQLLFHLFPIFFHYWKFDFIITSIISSVCPRSCGLFRLPSKCFNLSTSEYLHSFFSPRCDHFLSFSCRFSISFP